MYYVTMNDKVLSGWGKAQGKINKLVLTCETEKEAFIVMENAKNRGDMSYINYRTSKPYYNSRRYVVSYHDKEDYANWYKDGYFTK